MFKKTELPSLSTRTNEEHINRQETDLQIEARIVIESERLRANQAEWSNRRKSKTKRWNWRGAVRNAERNDKQIEKTAGGWKERKRRDASLLVRSFGGCLRTTRKRQAKFITN